jgi:quercetin dioxygenase-like cupin family protein
MDKRGVPVSFPAVVSPLPFRRLRVNASDRRALLWRASNSYRNHRSRTLDRAMTLIEQVEHHEIMDLTEFSKEEFVRKPIMQSKGIVCDFVCFEPGQTAGFHKHPVQDEIFYVVEGTGVITFEDRADIPVKPGSVVFTPSGVVHGVETTDSDRLVLMLIKGPGFPDKASRFFMHGD